MNEIETEKRILRIEKAVFGDGNGNAGMEQQLKDIHKMNKKIFEWTENIEVGGKLTKWVVAFILGLGMVSVGLGNIWAFVKHIFSN